MSNVKETYKDELFENIRNLLAEARKSIVKNINHTMVYTYFGIGRMIVEDEQHGKSRAEYGKKVLIELSERLTNEFGKGFSTDNLELMKRFYIVYASRITSISDNEISETVSRKFEIPKSKIQESEIPSQNFNFQGFQLSWSHYVKLIRIQDEEERRFYEIEAVANNWGLKELKRQCDSALYQRLALSRDKKGIRELSERGQIIEKPEDAFKDPLIIEFAGLPENSQYSESELEQKLIDKLEYFMLELGKGFTFVGRQVRITIDEKHFRVDLVFFNRYLKAFVLVDLKIGELTHQDIGQMQMYVNYYDRYVRLKNENKTIGIILCQDKSEILVKITLPEDNRQIFASRYQTILPSKDELKKLIEI
jgi:predicted nuclease of restriction endonuclease-like (RecB) superfamily